ncbi:uncharacterized protein TNCV_1944711 [Trichonephila clavipes]|nr:uncharacterized protein TNCV_1944711 [Trichonephila clavipes]
MESESTDLMLHNNVRWLSRENVLKRFASLFPEIEAFLLEKGVQYRELTDDQWIQNLYFMEDDTSTVKSLNDVRSQVKSAYQSNRAITDIDVTFDGTWLTRGHSSQIGLGCVIDLLTGFVMDFLKLCQNAALNVNTQNLVWEKIQQNSMCGMKDIYLHVLSIA